MGISVELFGKSSLIVRLDPIVEFFLRARGELLDHGPYVDTGHDRTEETGKSAQGLEIGA